MADVSISVKFTPTLTQNGRGSHTPREAAQSMAKMTEARSAIVSKSKHLFSPSTNQRCIQPQKYSMPGASHGWRCDSQVRNRWRLTGDHHPDTRSIELCQGFLDKQEPIRRQGLEVSDDISVNMVSPSIREALESASDVGGSGRSQQSDPCGCGSLRMESRVCVTDS